MLRCKRRSQLSRNRTPVRPHVLQSLPRGYVEGDLDAIADGTDPPVPTGQTRRRGMRSQQPISPALSLRQRHVDRGKAFDGQTVSEHVLHLPLQLQSEGNAGVAQRQRRPFRQLPGHFPSPWQ